MKQIYIGASAKEKTVVSSANTARAAQSGSLLVFATPFMIALMEKATCRAVGPFLEDDETTVGTGISVSHDKASGIGEEITAYAEIANVNGRKITFNVYAENEKSEIIGKGEIERFVVSGEKFMSKINGKKD
ncbi:MAG: hypothetical protein LIO43_05190 [Clostridiales bacterium]|nr:hypothetical protein [Clostridiales bacterium]MCD7872552.1 hypothetical protein [Clostridiales bacterium]